MRAALRAATPPRVYIDTSVWCSYCFHEPESPQVRHWLGRADLDHCATALWTRTEFASAAALKQRARGHSAQAVALASQAFDAALEMTHTLDAIADDFLYAAELCAASATGLRAGDALHLAVALRHNCQALASLDRAMNESARQLGMTLVTFE